jgi:hypothetical protein
VRHITYDRDSVVLTLISMKGSGCVDRDKCIVIGEGILNVLDGIYCWVMMSDTPEIFYHTYILGFIGGCILNSLERDHIDVFHGGSKSNSKVRIIRNFSIKLDMGRISHCWSPGSSICHVKPVRSLNLADQAQSCEYSEGRKRLLSH